MIQLRSTQYIRNHKNKSFILRFLKRHIKNAEELHYKLEYGSRLVAIRLGHFYLYIHKNSINTIKLYKTRPLALILKSEFFFFTKYDLDRAIKKLGKSNISKIIDFVLLIISCSDCGFLPCKIRGSRDSNVIANLIVTLIQLGIF